jgi:recyclin-1
LSLPVDFVSTAAITIASPFQRTSFTKQDKRISTQSIDSSASSTKSIPSSPRVSTNKRSSTPENGPASPHNRPASPGKDATVQLEFARQELDLLQNYISLETSLQIIHINKESESRIQQFINVGFPGRMKSDM